jgi:hypothetical protein
VVEYRAPDDEVIRSGAHGCGSVATRR